MRFADGDEVIIKENTHPNYKRFSEKKGKILFFSVIFNEYVVKIGKKGHYIPEYLITTELKYFMEEMTNEIQ